ncbi:hypothetical protein MNBD_DELTA03-757 [hydrothermal vent metagenome]|uniref:Response regulatory domain-containing protein n=1 Tax=hydrothermal vent metagenome TaxID=652676 RepID=A0A3B0UR22_9ZZZZ
MNFARKIEILLVDDSNINLALMKEALSDYKTMAVDNGLDALLAAAELRPGLILLDIQMPIMDGYEVCRKLKAAGKTRDIPIIFITGLIDPDDVARGFKAGAVDYVAKPFDFTEVRARIKTQLALSKARFELMEQNRILAQKVREQQIDAALASRIIRFINGGCPRYIDISDNLSLFIRSLRVPCHLEGGDHYLLRTMGDFPAEQRTIISLKDQSGHSVNCMLRSIVTDLLHNSLLDDMPGADCANIFGQLNERICRSNFFAGDDFCTAVSAEIEHSSLKLRHVSAGHPPIILIRGQEVRGLSDGELNNLPLAVVPGVEYQAGEVQLQPGDKLIFYTDGLNSLGQQGLPLRLPELLALVSEIVKGRAAMPVNNLLRDLLQRLWGDEGSRRREDLDDDLSLLLIEIEDSSRAAVQELRPADFGNIDELVNVVRSQLPAGVRGSCQQMALSEAVLNAWHHGSSENPTRPILLRCWQGNDWNMEITDSGPGFDPDKIPDPVEPAKISNLTGRGIFAMRKFCSSVRWRDGGRKVVLSFKN